MWYDTGIRDLKHRIAPRWGREIKKKRKGDRQSWPLLLEERGVERCRLQRFFITRERKRKRRGEGEEENGPAKAQKRFPINPTSAICSAAKTNRVGGATENGGGRGKGEEGRRNG